MRTHEKQGSTGSSSSRCCTLVVLSLLAVGAAVAWLVRRRHVGGIAEADAWREDLPQWAGPTGTGARASVERAEAVAPLGATTPVVAPAPEPAPPAAASDDDLRRVEGIGPRIATALTAAGLGTYAAVADASDGDLRAALKDAGLRFAPSLSTWARQARLLADGDEAGFVALTDMLVAGREES